MRLDLQNFMKTHVVTNPFPKANDLQYMYSLRGINTSEKEIFTESEKDTLACHLANSYKELRDISNPHAASLLRDAVDFVIASCSKGNQIKTNDKNG